MFVPLRIARWFAGGRQGTTAAPGIEKFFLLFCSRFPIVLDTPLVGTLPSMMLSTAKRTTQIDSTRVAGMSQKSNPAMNAVHRTVTQFGIVFQNRVQRGLILTHKRLGAIVLVPILAKRENFLDC